MGKNKAVKGVSNPHLHARVSYLFQAANYLYSQRWATAASGNGPIPDQQMPQQDASTQADNEAVKGRSSHSIDKNLDSLGQSRRLLAHMRTITLKSQVRLSRELKRSVCTRCDTLLVPGDTSRCFIENKSKGGEKPWADVYVVECLQCGAQKRFPVGSKRQPKGRQKKTIAPENIKAEASAPKDAKEPD